MKERELFENAIQALESLVESHGYTSYISDEEKEAEVEVIFARSTIASIKKVLSQPELCKYGQEPKSCTSSPMDYQCALDATFAQTEQEPYAWEFAGTIFHDRKEVFDWYERGDISDIPPLALYTTPPQRTWVGLDDIDLAGCGNQDEVSLARYWERVLMEKNK